MSATTPSFRLLVPIVFVLLAGCDSGSEDDCLEVTPSGDYVLTGTEMTTNFAPPLKTYVVRNSCASSISLSVEEDERWLDIDIIGGGGSEQGTLSGGGTVNVEVGVVYGDDNPERLDQLAEGSYESEIRFVDATNDTEVTRSVRLTVTAP